MIILLYILKQRNESSPVKSVKMAYIQLPTHLLITAIVILNIAHSESSLQQIHVLFRHGARTPSAAGLYPNDPYLNDTWYPDGLGAITKLGKQQGYKIGTTLRAKYGEFLGNIYTADILETRTTSYDRTKITMSLLLAGLWPPAPVQQWDSHLIWQPIPYNYVPYENDSLLGFPSWYCPEYAKEYENIVASDGVVNFLKTNRDMIDYINKHSGLNIQTTIDMFELYMGLYAEETAGKVLPEWTKKIYPEFLANVTKFEYKIQTDSNVLVKATGGPLVKKVINDARSKMDGQLNPSGRKLFLYSAHEYNIAYVLSALKMYELQIPYFASYVVIELHEIDNVYGFMVYYEDYTGNDPKLMTVQGCEEFCPFDRFIEIVKDIIPEKEWC